ncbi:hypothetical protein N7448_002968 [Penicillium atrosanguineum]|uniref:Uncharacterized protein n=1 Tax=Penicillium atrosanguineum TaxID=1132637 RepID=A0A9W9L768_9EURO|nr:uncharacterized protein N7443_001944 [Penicillium atrosanguineum]KAJ5121837.1 hypothetical protein N7526_008774 [Penicillium atrosanguineum]KAJ5139560.1 hypothetical protein N7448_002968 [Penicillium atrosanguineum]KAJ5309483.1 hypothetical protein N7443_001944 [Penicillium atrosanguineum]KAJ5315003.1 hypothetical protein N7476_005310 [Penicillium atrosanguineum]
MASKRKASPDWASQAKRLHQAAMDSDDRIYEEAHSDADYSAPATPSAMDEDMLDTPATPFSTTSSRYPSELKTHRCPFESCSKAFNRPARLQEHIRSHNNERLFQCTFEDCDKTFLRASHLTHHIKSAHTGVRDYVCDRPGCGKSFVTGSRLRRHIAAHDGRDKYRCTEYPPCEETFRKHSTLQKHITTVHMNKKPFPCVFVDLDTGKNCQMAFDTAGHLRAHESRVHTEKRFSCEECSHHLQEQASDMGTFDPHHDYSVTFPTYTILQEHIRNVHPPKCPSCPIVCSTSRELRRHLEVAHGDVSLEERKVFPCTIDGCDRSFTKKGNLTVHIRTVHQGEKRFGCGETDLSVSKKVEGWDGIGCGKRYGSKLALEEHIRTAHLGYPNAKAERRQRLGLDKSSSASHISTLAALTGQGYAEETGRHILCFYDSCEHRFHRDYDLWVHMTAKHSCSEDEVQGLFMQRALLSDQIGPGGNALGIYGLEFDRSEPSHSHGTTPPNGVSSDPNIFSQLDNSSGFPENNGLDADFLMQDTFSADAERNIDSVMPSHDEMALMDPVLAYHLMEG